MALNILVVDDSNVMRAMIIKSLRMSGTPLGEIHEARNGAEGLDLLRSATVDLVIADINMPVMNGEEMVNRIQADPALSGVAVLIISTEGSEARLKPLQEKGAAFIHKPFSPEKIRDTIKTITETGGSDE